jgi:hypothetical protein
MHSIVPDMSTKSREVIFGSRIQSPLPLDVSVQRSQHANAREHRLACHNPARESPFIEILLDLRQAM